MLLLIGPLFLGCAFNWCLCGALIVQLYDYCLVYHNTDRLFIKSMVYSVFCMELFQTTSLTMFMWDVFVSRFGDISIFDVTPWTSWVAPALNGIVSTVVQLFFAWRIWSLKKTKTACYIAALISFIALMQGAAGIVITVQYAEDPSPAHLHLLQITVQVWLIGSCVCDMLIAITMVIILTRARKLSTLRGTETLINRLIANSIESGSITAVLAILELSFYSAYPENYLHVLLMHIRGRAYSNVLLAALNGRKRAIRPTIDESGFLTTASQLQFAGSQTLYEGQVHEVQEDIIKPGTSKSPVVEELYLSLENDTKGNPVPVGLHIFLDLGDLLMGNARLKPETASLLV